MTANQQRIPLLSFFTGGGFLDLGFERSGFEIVWTNEVDPRLAQIYAKGITNWRRATAPRVPTAKISCISSIDGLKAAQILKEAFGDHAPPVFGVIGGPPCADFSNGGLHAGHGGSAGRLTSIYIRQIRLLKPTFFVLENVPHLASNPKHSGQFHLLLRSLERAGFAYVQNVLNALEHGVPQDRSRLFVVGFRHDVLRRWFPEAYSLKRMLEMEFDWPAPLFPRAKTAYSWPKTDKFQSIPTQPEGVPLALCAQSALEGQKDPESVTNGKEFFVPISEKFKLIDEGDVCGKSFKRLHRYRYSPTAWYGNNEVHLHPWKPRRLSVREAMRLQSIPDEYVMPSDMPLSIKFKAICNGVPCRLAECLAVQIRTFIVSNEQRASARARRHGSVLSSRVA